MVAKENPAEHYVISPAVVAWGVLVLSILLVWFSAGDHPLYPPDEGRYATVSTHMVTEGDWLVPHFDGHVHLTKPPLTYWAQAISLKWLGHNEYAIRAPSLIAASLSLGILFFAGWRLRGPRLATLTVALTAVMPLFIIVNRLAITDPLLNTSWLGALLFGWIAAGEGKWRWSILLWLSVSIGLMVKGPLALAPVGILLVWLWVGRNWMGLKRLHMLLGLPLALAPLALWVWSVIQTYPEAGEIWRHEMLDRITGDQNGAHQEPFWFYLPIFLGGLFPITTMLPIPGYTVSWATIRRRLGAASPLSLWVWAAILPFILFSLMSGKLHSYLLPLCGPWAILSATMLDQWITAGADQPEGIVKPPEVVITFGLSLIIITTGMLGAAWWLEPELLWAAAAWIPVTIAAIWMWRTWKQKPQSRSFALGVVWLLFLVGWLGIYEGEDDLRRDEAPVRMIGWLDGYMSGTGDPSPPNILIYGYRNHILNFYLHHELLHLYSPVELRTALAQINGPCLVFADQPAWRLLENQDPPLALAFEPIGSFNRWFGKDTLMLRYRNAPNAASSHP